MKHRQEKYKITFYILLNYLINTIKILFINSVNNLDGKKKKANKLYTDSIF